MSLDGPLKQHVFDSCAGADVVNDQNSDPSESDNMFVTIPM